MTVIDEIIYRPSHPERLEVPLSLNMEVTNE